jgi:hypothetical protein
MLVYWAKRVNFWAILLITHHAKIPVFHYSKIDDMTASAQWGTILPGVKEPPGRTGLNYES